MDKSAHEANRLSWNEATVAHNSHKEKQAAFFRAGGSTLFSEEIELLGDIEGKKVVHLQCNAGQDTLSLAQLGAEITGVDISDVAINFARRLSLDSGVKATFERADIYDWLVEKSAANVHFDVAFSSYGALAWLSDIELWAVGIAGILGKGGRLVVVDFHPFLLMFDDDWSLNFDYFGNGKAILLEDGIGDYVADSGQTLTPSGYLDGVKDFKNPHPAFEFQWGIGEIVTAVIKAGFNLTTFTEYPYMNGAKLRPDMVSGERGRMYPPGNLPSLPLMFGLAASLPD